MQAPEHVVENLRLEAKAAGDPKKKKKLHRKKPPTRGYVHWTKDTFNKLVSGEPEPLSSHFSVSHGMLLNVLSREQGGCRAMKQLIRDCHDRPAVKHRHAKTAIQMFRALVEADVISLADQPGRIAKRAVVNVDLQREFSMHYALSLYVIETIKELDVQAESYALDLLSLVESILEDPHLILRKQLDRIKGEAVAEMKAAGMEYDERMEELEKLTYPKPNADFIYATFNDYAERHPWVGMRNIRPKGVAREIYESAHDFRTFVVEHKLERAEGSVLRYMTDVYKALVQTVPSWARTYEVDLVVEHFSSIVRGIDASLIAEWEQLRDPTYVPVPIAEREEVVESRGITADERAFTVLLRNAVFRLVKALAAQRYEAAAAEVDDWPAERFAETLAPYFEEHGNIRTDPKARGTEHTLIDKKDGVWNVRQKLVDPDDHNDWYLAIRVDLERSDEEGKAVIVLDEIRT